MAGLAKLQDERDQMQTLIVTAANKIANSTPNHTDRYDSSSQAPHLGNRDLAYQIKLAVKDINSACLGDEKPHKEDQQYLLIQILAKEILARAIVEQSTINEVATGIMTLEIQCTRSKRHLKLQEWQDIQHRIKCTTFEVLHKIEYYVKIAEQRRVQSLGWMKAFGMK
jgi:hypothetical protein